MFKVRFIELVWQSRGVEGSRKPYASEQCPYYLGSVSQVSSELEDGKWRNAHWEWMALLRIENRPSL